MACWVCAHHRVFACHPPHPERHDARSQRCGQNHDNLHAERTVRTDERHGDGGRVRHSHADGPGAPHHGRVPPVLHSLGVAELQGTHLVLRPPEGSEEGRRRRARDEHSQGSRTGPLSRPTGRPTLGRDEAQTERRHCALRQQSRRLSRRTQHRPRNHRFCFSFLPHTIMSYAGFCRILPAGASCGQSSSMRSAAEPSS